LRGIREVTDKNKHILLEAVFSGEFIPDHLLPVGIHRCGQLKWRAHLCTVGLKFSGPPRDTVRDSCEDRRRFCEENGVNFVLYGKQTHAKGPIGSRPVVNSGFPRLSDYISSLSRGSTAGSGRDGPAVLAMMVSNNPQMKVFLEAIDDAKKILKARQAEDQGLASYMVTPSHAELHKRIVEDNIDQPVHVYHKVCKMRSSPYPQRYDLCPIKIQATEGVLIRFVISSSRADAQSLYAYLDSILVNANPPMNPFYRDDFIRRLITRDVAQQLVNFERLNDRIDELLEEHGSSAAAIRFVHQTAPHIVSTRKHSASTAAISSPVSNDPSNPIVDLDLGPGIGSVSWNVLSDDSIAEDFSAHCENEQDTATAGDILFTIIDRSVRQRQVLFFGPQGIPKKTGANPIDSHVPLHSGLNVDENQIKLMNREIDAYEESLLSTPIM